MYSYLPTELILNISLLENWKTGKNVKGFKINNFVAEISKIMEWNIIPAHNMTKH